MYMYSIYVCTPESDIPDWILVAMVTDHTGPFVDVPEPHRAILGRREQKLSSVVETRTVHSTTMA